MTAPEDTNTPAPQTGPQASLYQQLRGHLAVLKLHDAAEHLPAVLDAATAQKLSITAALERLLAIEVDATEARRLAGRLRFEPARLSCRLLVILGGWRHAEEDQFAVEGARGPAGA